MAGGNVTAKVNVKGLSSECVETMSEKAPVAPPIIYEPLVDEWARVRPNEERARLDSLFAELVNSPVEVGVLYLVITGKEIFGRNNPRVQLVKKHAHFRNFDISRIVFFLVKGTQRRTKVFRIRPDYAHELCDDNCLIIKGGDL